MTDTPTDEIAERLANLLAKATPGEWRSEWYSNDEQWIVLTNDSSWNEGDSLIADFNVLSGCDAQFVALAKNHLPALLTERAEMKARITALEGENAIAEAQARDEVNKS